MSAKTTEPEDDEIRLVHVRIREYRCLRKVDVALDDEVVLIGENSSGKTSFLDALHLAIGLGQKTVDEDDIYVSAKEESIPKDRTITIDILIRPTDRSGIIKDAFPSGSKWVELWGNGVGQDSEENDFVGIRTEVKWSTSRGEYVLERRFLKSWVDDPDKWTDATPMEGRSLGPGHIEPIALHYIDAKRDMATDLVSRGSIWNRLASDPELPKDVVEALEQTLSDINDTIISNSQVLGHLQDHLQNLTGTIACDDDSVRITAVSRRLRDMKKGMDIVLATNDGPVIPIARQGMGTRSMTSLLTFRAFVAWRVKKASRDPFHAIVAIEEPEAHLQPQAQRSLVAQLKQIPGQRIVTTHSPYVCGQTSILKFRHFSKENGETSVTSIEDNASSRGTLSEDDIRRIDRMVINTRGELLFARGLLLFEGDTEEQALPGLAGLHWKRHVNELGFTFLGVGGHGNYRPFLVLANRFGIPWRILSDGEPEAIKSVEAALAAEKLAGGVKHPNVVIIPKGMNFEQFIASNVPRAVLEAMIVAANESGNPRHKEALTKEWNGKSMAEIVDELVGDKTKYGSMLSRFIEQHGTPIPKLFTDVFDSMEPPPAVESVAEERP